MIVNFRCAAKLNILGFDITNILACQKQLDILPVVDDEVVFSVDCTALPNGEPIRVKGIVEKRCFNAVDDSVDIFVKILDGR